MIERALVTQVTSAGAWVRLPRLNVTRGPLRVDGLTLAAGDRLLVAPAGGDLSDLVIVRKL